MACPLSPWSSCTGGVVGRREGRPAPSGAAAQGQGSGLRGQSDVLPLLGMSLHFVENGETSLMSGSSSVLALRRGAAGLDDVAISTDEELAYLVIRRVLLQPPHYIKWDTQDGALPLDAEAEHLSFAVRNGPLPSSPPPSPAPPQFYTPPPPPPSSLSRPPSSHFLPSRTPPSSRLSLSPAAPPRSPSPLPAASSPTP